MVYARRSTHYASFNSKNKKVVVVLDLQDAEFLVDDIRSFPRMMKDGFYQELTTEVDRILQEYRDEDRPMPPLNTAHVEDWER